jgi:chromosomal replication initiation ATPase DnaA
VTQLGLAFPPAVPPSPALLPHAGQDEARAWLARPDAWAFGRLVLWGPAGSGKTHLLRDWAAGRGALVLTEAPRGLWPDRPVALDGLEGAEETALFHLLNAATETRQPVLLTARAAPARLEVGLADLASRLRGSAAVAIGPAPDGFLRLLLARLLAERQLRVPASVQDYVLRRLERSPAAVAAAAAALEGAVLARQRPVTRALAAEALGLRDIPETVSPRGPGFG